MKFAFGFLLSGMVLLVSVPLQAQGILFVQKEVRGSSTTTNQVQIDKNYMRSESSGDQTAVTFDGPKQTMRILNLGSKTYREVTIAELQQLKQQLDGAMANLTPAQRAMMEQMLQGRGMPGMPGMAAAVAAPAKPVYRAAGSDKVGQWACKKYEGYVNDQKTVEVCATEPKDLGLTAADFDITRQLGEFMKAIVPDIAEKLTVNATVQDQGFAGIAVRRTTFRNGAVDTVTEITELKRQAFPASTFEVPAGFKKEAGLGGRGAR